MSAAAARTSACAKRSMWPPACSEVASDGHEARLPADGRRARPEFLRSAARARRTAPARPGGVTAACAERVPPHRRGRLGDGRARALRDGPGRLDRARDPDRRGARLRLVEGALRARAGEPRALRTAGGRNPDDRGLVVNARRVRSLPHRRREREGHARPRAFGATLVDFDAAAALRVPGVEKVVPTATGVAVVAKHFWAAKLGRDALVTSWRDPEGSGFDSTNYTADLRALTMKPGAIVADVGKVDEALAAAKTTLEAVYEVPYLAHAPMEPLNCTAKIDGDRCEIWTGTQFQSVDQIAAAQILGTTPDKVRIHTTFLGGGFGRRANPQSDFVAEAVVVAKNAGVPVKVVWTREDDIRGGWYRPAYVHRVRVAVDASGGPVAG